jgi:hypothetical protein
MGLSALRIAACVGVLVVGLMLGGGTAGLAFAEPAGAGHRSSDEQASKGVNNMRAGWNQVVHRILGEQRRRAHSVAPGVPRAKIGSTPDRSFVASESSAATTFADVDEETNPPQPELAPDGGRITNPDGTQVGTEGTDPGGGTPEATDAGSGDGVAALNNAEVAGGSDYTDNTVVTDNTAVGADPAPVKQQTDTGEYPFLYFVLEVRRGGGGWWNATMIISRRQQAMREPTPEPEPEPQIATAPAFRGGAPEAPAPEPVLDASGGVAGGGSDYQATGFGGAPVLSAPIVAAPVPPPAAARFPAFPPAGTAAPGLGSATARAPGTAPGSTAAGRPTAGPRERTPAVTVRAMSGQTPRQGYTDYLRSPGLPQLAGAALPGVAGIVLMTLGGGVIGYRQANAGRMIRASGAARYLP